MAAKKKPAPDTSSPAATESQAGVSAAVKEQSSVAASTEPVTQSEPTVETPAASPEGGYVAAQLEDMAGEPGAAIQVDGQGLAPISATPEPVVTALLVTARRDGFRRAGRSWSRQQTRVGIDELNEDEIAALLAEPMLDVVGVAD